MPANFILDRDTGLLVSLFSGSVTGEEVLDLIARIDNGLASEGAYRSLVLFDRPLNLSEIDVGMLDTIRERDRAMFRNPGRQRLAGAAVVDHAHDAQFIVPLYNALCDRAGETDMRFEIFAEPEPALDTLGIPRETGMATIAQARAANGTPG